MCKRTFVQLSVCAVLLACLKVPEIQAQAGKAPEAYTVTEVVSLFGPSANMQVQRDGNKAMVEQSYPPQQPGAKGGHTRTLYDLEAHTAITWDLTDSAIPCGKSNFSGDWGDPFAMSGEMSAALAQQHATEAGTETINGTATKVLQATTNDGVAKAWVDAKTGFIWKLQLTPKTGPMRTLIDVKQVSLAKPAASVFAMPASCAAAANAPRTPTEAERFAAETGGNGQDFTNANIGPGSKNSCTALLRVVQAGSMQPITGFQVAVDKSYDVDHPPNYSFGVGTNGHMTFHGGAIQEMTAQVRNGVLRIDNVPAMFDLELAFGTAGSSSAVVYRKCETPETVLLFVVKNPAKISDGSDWLWVKSGKYATVK